MRRGDPTSPPDATRQPKDWHSEVRCVQLRMFGSHGGVLNHGATLTFTRRLNRKDANEAVNIFVENMAPRNEVVD